MQTTTKQYEHRVVDGNIGYFRFYRESTWEDYQAGLDDYMKIISDPKIEYLVVRNDHDGQWDKQIEGIWIETGRMLDQYGIKKWGVVVADSSIRKMTMKRVVNQGSLSYKPKYEIFLDSDEDRVFDWVRKG